ncbi:hypothetical protein HC891_15465 [Candidatus Gracilibacteria bacterium]|nr:hypothetical protein [Candidatus Gracilibacteria bacterium]
MRSTRVAAPQTATAGRASRRLKSINHIELLIANGGYAAQSSCCESTECGQIIPVNMSFLGAGQLLARSLCRKKDDGARQEPRTSYAPRGAWLGIILLNPGSQRRKKLCPRRSILMLLPPPRSAIHPTACGSAVNGWMPPPTIWSITPLPPCRWPLCPTLRPPTFVLFVNDPELVHFSYLRYLENKLRAQYPLDGTPIRMFARARTRRDERGDD